MQVPGAAAGAQKRGGAGFQMADQHYLWALVAVELLLTVALRRQFRNNHGG
jgi:hypothetical protein